MPEKKAKKKRLDEIVVERGFSETRASAKKLIMSGKIRFGTEILDKPGKSYPEDIELIMPPPPKYVSRGGEKLEGYLKIYPFEIKSKRALDVGASTGGFTDCLLQNGATEVTCIDVGRCQLHSKLVNDERVTNLEKTNARSLTKEQLPHDDYDIIVIDVSFISLKLILPNIWQFLKPEGRLIALIKPQFEAGKKEVDRGKGIIKDPKVHKAIVSDICYFVEQELKNSCTLEPIPSPIKGTDGNVEFLIGISKKPEM